MTKTKKAELRSKRNDQQCVTHEHPDHSKEAIRIKRVRGQLDGILKMIEGRQYCPDIMIQVRAAKSAMQAIEHSILKTHMASCVSEVLHGKDEKKTNVKIEELIKLIERHK